MSCDPKPLTAEQCALFRQCGENILRRHRAGQKFSAEALADARRWAAFPVVRTPAGTGVQVPDEQLPPALRGGALEIF